MIIFREKEETSLYQKATTIAAVLGCITAAITIVKTTSEAAQEIKNAIDAWKKEEEEEQ